MCATGLARACASKDARSAAVALEDLVLRHHDRRRGRQIDHLARARDALPPQQVATVRAALIGMRHRLRRLRPRPSRVVLRRPLPAWLRPFLALGVGLDKARHGRLALLQLPDPRLQLRDQRLRRGQLRAQQGILGPQCRDFLVPRHAVYPTTTACPVALTPNVNSYAPPDFPGRSPLRSAVAGRPPAHTGRDDSRAYRRTPPVAAAPSPPTAAGRAGTPRPGWGGRR